MTIMKKLNVRQSADLQVQAAVLKHTGTITSLSENLDQSEGR